jgi:hypothetical protein
MLRKAQLGDIAYPGYTPAQAGVVIKVEDHTEFNLQHIIIETLKGQTIRCPNSSFNFYDELVEEHRRKHEKHKKILDALLKKRGEVIQ